MTFIIKVQHPEDTGKTLNRKEWPNLILCQFKRTMPENPEQRVRCIAEIVVKLRQSFLRFNDIMYQKHNDPITDDVLVQYIRKAYEQHPQVHNEVQDENVNLRLSMMRTFWELRGVLDLGYIDTIIQETIKNFKTKYSMKRIEQKYWKVVADMCQKTIEHALRIEAEEEISNLDIEPDNINDWFE